MNKERDNKVPRQQLERSDHEEKQADEFHLQDRGQEVPRPGILQPIRYLQQDAPIVLGLSCIFSFFAITYQIVSDKQMKLGQSLRTVGLRDTSFWMSLFIIATVLAFAYALLLFQ